MGWADIFKQPVAPSGGTAAPVGPGIQAPVEDVTRTTQPVGQPQLPPSGAQLSPQQIEALAAQFMAGKPSGPETMQALKAFLESKGVSGIQIPTRAGGSALSSDKLAINGAVYDFLGDEGGANRFQMVQDGYWVNGQPSSRPDVVYNPPEGFSLQGRNGLASFDAPGLLAPWTQEFQDRFQMPTPENMLASPSYQWNRSRGLDGLDKRSSAAGTYNTGGADADRMEFASGLASAEYDKNFDRGLALRASDMGLYGMNRDTFWGNQGNAFNRLNATTQAGLGAAGNYADAVAGTYENMANANAAKEGVTGSNTGNVIGSGINTGLGALFDWLGRRGTGG